jgi:hypothetical protein
MQKINRFKLWLEVLPLVSFIAFTQFLGTVETSDTQAFRVDLNQLSLLGFNEKNGILYQILLSALDERILILLQSIIFYCALDWLVKNILIIRDSIFKIFMVKSLLVFNPFTIDWSRTLLPDVINLSLIIIFFIILFHKKHQSRYFSSLAIIALTVFSLRYISGIILLCIVLTLKLISFKTKFNLKKYARDVFILVFMLVIFIIITDNYGSQGRLKQMYREHQIVIFGKENSYLKEFYYKNGLPSCTKLENIWSDTENNIDWGTFMHKQMQVECVETYRFINQNRISHIDYFLDPKVVSYFANRTIRASFPEVAPRTILGDFRVVIRFFIALFPILLFLILYRFKFKKFQFQYSTFVIVYSWISLHSVFAMFIDGKEPSRHLLPFSFIIWWLPLLALKKNDKLQIKLDR